MLEILLPALFSLSFGWGTPPLSPIYRPQTAWTEQFRAQPDIIAQGDPNEAIAACDRIVGASNACTVGIKGGALDTPIVVSRSYTRLTAADATPLRATRPGSMIYIGSHTSYVMIDGLRLEGTDVGDDALFGVMVSGSDITHIAVVNNTFTAFSTDNGQAHAVGIYGTGGDTASALKHLVIDGNTVTDMRLGSGEAIALNGNVERWQISNNRLRNLNNIAIDIIGGEGTSPTNRDASGRTLPGVNDAARYGFVEDNLIENLHTLDNPAYGNRESWAAAIYIDGAHHIDIRRNRIVNSAWGLEIGAENCVVAHHIFVYANQTEANTLGDLLLGGYRPGGYISDPLIVCDPLISDSDDEGHGYVRYISVLDNTFASQDTRYAPIHLLYRVTHTVIAQEGVTAQYPNGGGAAQGDDNAVRTDVPPYLKTMGF